MSGVCVGFDQTELEQVLNEFQSVVSNKTGETNLVKLHIDTQDAVTVAQPPYSVPMALREVVRDELESLERAGIIERSDSPWASLLVPVRKSNNKIRLCVDIGN